MQNKLFYIRDMETLRLMADTMRAQMLEMLIREQLNARQIAARLGLQTSKIYYHLGLLEKHGLIEVVETVQVGNLIEKSYRAVAENFDVDPGLINFKTGQGRDNLTNLVDSTLGVARTDVIRSLEARFKELQAGAPEEPRRVMMTRAMNLISEAHAQEFFARLETLLQEFKDLGNAGVENGAQQMYSLTLIFNPTFYFPEEESGGGSSGIV